MNEEQRQAWIDALDQTAFAQVDAVSEDEHGFCLMGHIVQSMPAPVPVPKWRRFVREARFRISGAWRVLRHGEEEWY